MRAPCLYYYFGYKREKVTVKKVKCYIRGAYGPGNIGDDILMISTYRSLRRLFRKDEIYIGVENPKLAKKLIPEAEFLHIKKPFSAEIVVLGGGGQFFSFTPPPAVKKQNKYVKILSALKKQSNLLDTVTRLWIKAKGAYDNLYFAQNIGAYCIGLGPFETEGKNLERTKRILPSLDYISVRETTSASFYTDFVPNKEAKVYTDPSFNRELWIDKNSASDLSDREGADYISFIVRDWPHSKTGDEFLSAMFAAAKVLKRQGNKVRFICLYQERDEHLVARAPEFDWVFWTVDGTTPSSFMHDLCKSSKAIISARAHGVMLAAAFGMPTIAIEIEPKLNEIHKMLPTGTLLVSEPSVERILSEFERFQELYPKLQENIVGEYRQLELLSKQAENDLLSWVRKAV